MGDRGIYRVRAHRLSLSADTPGDFSGPVVQTSGFPESDS
jgi:hypothetical protein